MTDTDNTYYVVKGILSNDDIFRCSTCGTSTTDEKKIQKHVTDCPTPESGTLWMIKTSWTLKAEDVSVDLFPTKEAVDNFMEENGWHGIIHEITTIKIHASK